MLFHGIKALKKAILNSLTVPFPLSYLLTPVIWALIMWPTQDKCGRYMINFTWSLFNSLLEGEKKDHPVWLQFYVIFSSCPQSNAEDFTLQTSDLLIETFGSKILLSNMTTTRIILYILLEVTWHLSNSHLLVLKTR